MKYMNIIKLLTVLLCIGMLFVACDSAETESSEEVTTEATETTSEETTTATVTEAPTEAATQEPLLEGVAPEFNVFFEELTADGNKLTSAERLDGTIVGYTTQAIILYDVEIDAKNVVTETYKVINLLTGEEVLSVTNDYFNGDYDNFDFTSDDFRVFESSVLVDNGDGTFSAEEVSEKIYRDSYLQVSFQNMLVDYICVASAEVTPIDDETREANPDGCVYKVETKYSYYDVYGTLITESNAPLSVEYSRYTGKFLGVKFGAELASFDVESGRLVKTSGLATEPISELYRYENDRFGYYNPISTGVSYVMDIVEKSSGKVLRYHIDKAYQSFNIFYLHNGDVAIQYRSVVEETDPYDYYSYDGTSFTFYAIKTVILNVETGNETVIEQPAFVINDMMTGEEYADKTELGAKTGLALTEYARNIALVQGINDGVISDTLELRVLDNNLSVLYTYGKVIDQQTFDGVELGYELLANGDKLVSIGNPDTPFAIVAPDGTIRSYLDATMAVVGEYVADGTLLYDYDLNIICNYAEKDYVAIELFGECVFYSEKERRCMSFTVVNDEIILEDIFEERVEFVESTDSYAIFHNVETGKYTLYNESMTAVLASSQPITVCLNSENGYFALAFAGAEYVCYMLK